MSNQQNRFRPAASLQMIVNDLLVGNPSIKIQTDFFCGVMHVEDSPLTKHTHITERHYLTGNHASHALLAIAPPKQVGDAGPPGSVLSSASGARSVRQHEAQTPALRWVAYTKVPVSDTVSRWSGLKTFIPSSGYSAGSGFVCSFFASGTPWCPNCGCSGI